jgi:hypothetical protein
MAIDFPATPRREEISKLFSRKDYDDLSVLGIRIVEQPRGIYDCGNYLAQRLHLPMRPEIIALFRSLPEIDTMEHNAIVIYWTRKNPTHYGLVEGKRIISKWEHGPVFEHDVLDVPTPFGDRATFHHMTEEFKARVHEFLMGAEG